MSINFTTIGFNTLLMTSYRASSELIWSRSTYTDNTMRLFLLNNHNLIYIYSAQENMDTVNRIFENIESGMQYLNKNRVKLDHNINYTHYMKLVLTKNTKQKNELKRVRSFCSLSLFDWRSYHISIQCFVFISYDFLFNFYWN